MFTADVPGLPVLPGVARGDSIHQPARLHVLQRLDNVSEHQPGRGSQPLPGPAPVRYVLRSHEKVLLVDGWKICVFFQSVYGYVK